MGPDTLHIAKAFNVRLPDEKAPEDVHQHIRDLTRARRHKHVKMSTIYDKQTHCGVLEARGVHCPQVPLEAVAQQAWRCVSYKQKLR